MLSLLAVNVPVLSEHNTSTPYELSVRNNSYEFKDTYSEGFNGGEFLNDSLLLCEISGTDSQSGCGDNRKTVSR
jgi:hypothetical protein